MNLKKPQMVIIIVLMIIILIIIFKENFGEIDPTSNTTINVTFNTPTSWGTPGKIPYGYQWLVVPCTNTCPPLPSSGSTTILGSISSSFACTSPSTDNCTDVGQTVSGVLTVSNNDLIQGSWYNIMVNGTNTDTENTGWAQLVSGPIRYTSIAPGPITVGITPVSISSDGKYVWVANSGNNTVSQIDIATKSVINTISVGSTPMGISSDGTNVWVANNDSNNVSQINIDTGNINVILVGNAPYAISSDGTNVWVCNSYDNTVSKIDCASGKVSTTISVGTTPQGISSDGTNVWVANAGDGISPSTVSQINIDTGNINTISVGINPFGISSDGTNVWVVNNIGNTVSKIECASGNVLNTIQIDTAYNYPVGIFSDGINVWVTNAINNTGTVQIDCKTGALVGNKIFTGSGTYGVSSDGVYVWVTNSTDNTVSQILIKLN